MTKEDYEARVLNIPSKFGNIAKAYVTREAPEILGDSNLTQLQNYFNDIDSGVTFFRDYLNSPQFTLNLNNLINGTGNIETVISGLDAILASEIDDIEQPDISNLARELELGTINIYVLGYNNKKQLVGNTHFSSVGLPTTLTSNIKNYLENFKIMTDTITINDGYIVNSGVIFDVVAEKYANKQ